MESKTKNTTFSPEINSPNKFSIIFTNTSPSVISQSVHAASHDLRTPLFVLRGYSQLLMRTQNLGNNETNKLKLMVEATQKMEDLINSMVELIDVQTLKPIEDESFSIKKLVKEIQMELINEISISQPKILLDFDSDLTVRFNRSFIFTIVKQFLQNAIVHNMDKENLTINLSIKKNNNELEIVVKDNGVGMDLSNGESILFKPFYRHSIIGKRAGVGLSIVKTIIDRIGGEISIKSELNEGTKCRVNLVL